jgi:hypothetical protein
MVALACTVVPGCKPQKKIEPVTVRIYSDLPSPYGPALDHRILDFQGTNQRLSNGKAVQVASVSIAELPSTLNSPDDPLAGIVIFNSPAEAGNYPVLVAEMTHAVNVCAALQACPAEIPALVPSKLQGEKAEAANRFVQFLTAAPPAPAAANSGPAPAQSQPAPPQSSH